MSTKFIPELVLPGGDLHRVKIAFLYGADAVYIGLSKHSLRKGEVRFNIADVKKAVEHAHSIGKKIYVTFNIFAHNKHLGDIEKDMRQIARLKPDAFIISDPGVIGVAKRVAKNVPIHLSTQANTVNLESVKFWQKQGIKRIVLGREVTLDEIKEIKNKVPKMELEVFVHGAMCISYSGRCLMSSALTGRQANLGECAQPCRWNYNIYLEEKQRPGEYFELTEDGKGAYVMNSKDLCLVEYLDKIAPYVDALKIEGRNKTDYYVAVTARVYRQALNAVKKSRFTPKLRKDLKKELESLTHRAYTTGFIFGKAKLGETFGQREPILGKKYVGYIDRVNGDKATVLVKNKIEAEKEYGFVAPNEYARTKVLEIIDLAGEPLSVISPGSSNKKVRILTDCQLSEDSFLREL